jgi:hypothetical protein
MRPSPPENGGNPEGFHAAALRLTAFDQVCPEEEAGQT